MAIGGYTTAILMTDHGVKDIWTIPLAIVVAGIVGLPLRLPGRPPLRPLPRARDVRDRGRDARPDQALRGLHRRRLGREPVRHAGADRVAHACEVLGFELNFNNWLYYLAWTIALVGYVVAWLILRGRTGRALRAVRDSETAAVSSGVNLTRAKAFAFGVSAAYAGAAGALFAIATTYVNPDTFPVALSIFLLVGVVVAGLGSLTGLIVGAIFIQFMPLWAQNISKSPGAPAVIYGVVLILLVLALPGGAAGLFARISRLSRRARDFQKP